MKRGTPYRRCLVCGENPCTELRRCDVCAWLTPGDRCRACRARVGDERQLELPLDLVHAETPDELAALLEARDRDIARRLQLRHGPDCCGAWGMLDCDDMTCPVVAGLGPRPTLRPR